MAYLRGNFRYRSGLRAQFNGFKLATSTYVLYILDNIYIENRMFRKLQLTENKHGINIVADIFLMV